MCTMSRHESQVFGIGSLHSMCTKEATLPLRRGRREGLGFGTVSTSELAFRDVILTMNCATLGICLNWKKNCSINITHPCVIPTRVGLLLMGRRAWVEVMLIFRRLTHRLFSSRSRLMPMHSGGELPLVSPFSQIYHKHQHR